MFPLNSNSVVLAVAFMVACSSLAFAQGGVFEGDTTELGTPKEAQTAESFIIPGDEVVDALIGRDRLLEQTKTKIYYEKTSDTGLKISLDTHRLVSTDLVNSFTKSDRTDEDALGFVKSILADNTELFGKAHQYDYVIDEVTT